MNYLEHLGANIRSLRKAYGETQPELGEAIGVEKNTISQYENGKREPDKLLLAAIAKHYMTSIEELLHSDLTGVSSVTIDYNFFWNNIDIYLPIVSSDKAMESMTFKRAYCLHNDFYSEMRKPDYNRMDYYFDELYDCSIDYLSTLEDDDTIVEAAINFIALWCLFMMFKQGLNIMRDQPAALKQIAKREEKFRRIIEECDPSFEEEAKDILSSIDDDDTKEIISELMIRIKRSERWSDLADYYLAIRYAFGIVDNGLKQGFNYRIGYEMLQSFAALENEYAVKFIKCTNK